MTPEKTANRIFKDTLFRDLFQKDVTAPANFLSLYNAIHGTNLKLEETKIQPIELENIFHSGFYNDVSMLLDDKIIVLVEHQSSLNENMPLRFLYYIAHLYEKLTDSRDKFLQKVKKIPRPEFYVFYNGKKDYPATSKLLLSNAFDCDKIKHKSNELRSELELVVPVYNINKCRDLPIMKNCTSLNGYADIVDLIISKKSTGASDYMKLAIQEALNRKILPGYLERKAKEVTNMFFAEDFDIEEALKMSYFEDGLEQGAHKKAIETASTAISMGMTQEVAAKLSGLSLAEIEQLQKQAANV